MSLHTGQLPATEDPAELLGAYAAQLDPKLWYRPPDPAERADCVAGATRWVSDDSHGGAAALEKLGFHCAEHVDRETNREYSLALTPPGAPGAWGVLLVDRSAPTRLLIEVPHPRADLDTEQTGVALLRRVPGAVLIMAGAHRRCADGAADVAHRPDSMFHAIATTLGRTLPEVQLHGFHDESAPYEVVLSPGSGKATQPIQRVGDELAQRGLDVCRAWRQRCADLEGKSNDQGRVAAREQRAFLHVEMSRSARTDSGRQRDIVESLATAVAD